MFVLLLLLLGDANAREVVGDYIDLTLLLVGRCKRVVVVPFFDVERLLLLMLVVVIVSIRTFSRSSSGVGSTLSLVNITIVLVL